MKALMMHPDRDFDGEQPMPAHASVLTQDLELETLVSAMAAGDEFIKGVARQALMQSWQQSIETVRYRQQVLADVLRRPDEVRELYALVVEAVEGRKKYWFGVFMRYPSAILSSSTDLMQFFAGMLSRVRRFAERKESLFESPAFHTLFNTLKDELSDAYIVELQRHLKLLKMPDGVLMSAGLGRGNEGVGYVLRLVTERLPFWKRWLRRGPNQFGFRLHERDEAGARFLGELRDRGINLAANALAQSCEHVLSFFMVLRQELAFYVGCLNLHERLRAAGGICCLPDIAATGTLQLRCKELRDACLVLAKGQSVVGNSVEAHGRGLIVITGANQGGKSSFLRAAGLAQLMMQAGMFVCAEEFSADRCTGLFTHYKREEDAELKSGKLDEELARLNEIVELIRPDGLLLSNESFSATNEREGSEIARQVVRALRIRRIKVIFVTHLYEFSRTIADELGPDALSLRAERRDDGSRTFKLLPGGALETSFGEDVYKEVFGLDAQTHIRPADSS